PVAVFEAKSWTLNLNANWMVTGSPMCSDVLVGTIVTGTAEPIVPELSDSPATTDVFAKPFLATLPFDRMSTSTPPEPAVDGPVVSVTLETAVPSVWLNFRKPGVFTP